jgi:hypothetical protein
VLNQPIEERPEGSDETVGAFGIPFVGFPVERRKRPKTGEWGQKPVWIEPDAKKETYRVRVPNVRSWAVGVTESLADLIRVEDLPQIRMNPKDAPEVKVRPVVGGRPEDVMTLEEFRAEWPLLKTAFLLASELFEATNPGSAAELGIGSTFDELLDVSRTYLESRVVPLALDDKRADIRDVGIYFWRQQARDVLETAIRSSGSASVEAVPILGSPEWLDSANLRRFQWTGIVADGKRCHTNKVPCHSDLEKSFADFLDRAQDVVRYFKNERLGFSVTYYESNRPRQYYPDFVIVARDADGREVMWLAEPRGEVRPNTALRSEAARLWCEKMSGTNTGTGATCSSSSASWRLRWRRACARSPSWPTRSSGRAPSRSFNCSLWMTNASSAKRSRPCFLSTRSRRLPATSGAAKPWSRRAGSKPRVWGASTIGCSSAAPSAARWSRPYGTATSSSSAQAQPVCGKGRSSSRSTAVRRIQRRAERSR